VQATRFVESYFDAWNHHDPKGVADHLAAGGIYFDIPENQQRSHDELITVLTDFFVDHQQTYELIGSILTSRDSIAFQYRVSSNDEVDVDVDGMSGSYSGAEFMALSGDAAIVITDYYDIPGMAQPGSFAHVAANSSLAIKYAKSGLSSTQLDELKCRLETIMQSDKTFLQSDLTLPKLAAIVDCSVNHLSQVINAGFGVSFFDYLNQHRIEYAKRQLRDYDGPNSAILNVAFAAGFNSNSAFYAAFKKCIGQTPAQYRKAQSSQVS
jgi:AraC-like DNA-binding protein